MFYIDTTQFFKRRDKFLLHTLPTIVVFLVFLGMVFLSWTTAKDNVREEQQRALRQRNTETAALITQRMDAYEQILRGARGLFDASDAVSRAEWRQYLATYNIAQQYPGIQGVGYAPVINKSGLSRHIQSVRAEGFPEYTVRPAGDRDIYTSITFIEPFKNRNLRAFGYDMYSEPVRQASMDTARDTSEPAMSTRVQLIQEPSDSAPQPGFLIYLALYKTKSVPSTIAERRQQLRGFAYLPFRSYDLINNTLATNDPSYGFQIYSLNGKQRELLYENTSYKSLADQPTSQSQTTRIEVSGRTWEIAGLVNDQVVSKNVSERPGSVLAGGILFCVVIAGFLYLLIGNRNRLLVEKEEQTIQHAKDELLALASHQLRTPATGVKQYVGMVREGFAGKITAQQRHLLDKAYESNERQLGTINEMLFVARADAGHLRMNRVPMDITAMVRDIADEQRGVIEQHRQKFVLKLPKRSILVRADQQYLRMALENILSNATKYTQDKGIITMQLKTHNNRVLFTVQDTGVGVAKKHQALLFKKFSRIPNELTNQVVGSGIGLYLAKQVVDAHKGTITFSSVENQGSTVTICLHKYSPKR